MILNDTVRQALTAGHLAHLVTLNKDGSPQVSIVWVGLDGDEIVCSFSASRVICSIFALVACFPDTGKSIPVFKVTWDYCDRILKHNKFESTFSLLLWFSFKSRSTSSKASSLLSCYCSSWDIIDFLFLYYSDKQTYIRS
jgi:hypothetical protein